MGAKSKAQVDWNNDRIPLFEGGKERLWRYGTIKIEVKILGDSQGDERCAAE